MDKYDYSRANLVIAMVLAEMIEGELSLLKSILIDRLTQANLHNEQIRS